MLARALAGRRSLTALLGICVGDKGAATVARCLLQTTNLARLTCYCCASVAGLSQITPSIGTLPHLRELGLGLLDKRLDRLTLGLVESARLSLTQLQIVCDTFNTDNSDVLGPIVSRCSQLRDLRVMAKDIETDGEEPRQCPHLAAFAGNLTRLHLESENEGTFIACIPTMTALQHLSLRAAAPRRESARDWQALCAPLAALPGLTALELETMLNPGDGGDAVAGLSLLTALRHLEFLRNPWDPSDVSAVAPALRHMAALTELQLYEPQWGRERPVGGHEPSLGAVSAAVAVLATHVSALSQLRVLDVWLWGPRHRELRDSAAGQALVRSLRRCPGARVIFGHDE